MHVLSTPPAFILSQDQTLMFKSLIVKFILNVTSVESEDSLLFVIFKCCLHSEISQRIFRVALLFICQGALLTVFDTQLVYIIMRLNRCQHLFLRFFNFFNLITTSQRWNYIVPFPILLVNY